MKKDKKNLRALCLSGGGSRGAFQVGALMHLMHNLNLEFDIITGISVGALNGSYLAQYKKGEEHEAIRGLHEVWCKVNNRAIWRHWFPFGMLHALWKQSLYQSTPLEKLVDKVLDTEKVRSTGKQLRVGFVALESGDKVYFTEKSRDLKNGVKASAAFPSFFRPVQIDGYGLCLDGGIKDIIPLKAAINLGAKHITIITTFPVAPHKLSKEKVKKMNTLDVSKRVIDLMSDEIVMNDLERFTEINRLIKEGKMSEERDGKRYIDYVLIQPDKCLASDPLDFNPKTIREMITKGYVRAGATT